MSGGPDSRLVRICLLAAIAAVGLSALVVQVTLMRELVSVFAGNELIFGIALGNWMLLGGLGAALGRTAARLRRPLTVLIAAQILLAFLPVADVFLLRALRNVIFVRGAEIGVTDTVVCCFVLLAPYCLLMGYLLTLASHLLARRETAAPIGQVYFLDNLGAVLGGVLVSFVLIERVSHFGMLYVPAALNLAAAGMLAWAACRWKTLLVVAAAAAAGIVVAAAWDLDAASAALRYPGQRIVDRGNSPYGNLVVSKAAGQYQFLENGVALFSTQNTERVEETVHYAMLQRPAARRVLVLSGGISGTDHEILKYPQAAVDDVELDPRVIEVARRWLPERLDDPRIRVLAGDGRLHVKRSRQEYDVAIIDVPAPSTSQINRFYTEEFFAELRRAMTPGGVVSIAIDQEYDGYVSPELSQVLGTLERTLRAVFANVLVLPGQRIFLLASDRELSGDAGELAGRLETARIATRWVTRPYLAAMLTPERTAGLRCGLRADAPLNRDFSPILYYYHLRWWMSQFTVRFGLLEAGLLVLLGAYLVRLRPVAMAVFASGFAASALEVVLLVAFQILYGSVYEQVALIVTAFMLGLGLGSLVMTWALGRYGRRALLWLLVALAAYAACLPPVLTSVGSLGLDRAPTASQAVVPLLALALAILVGMVFPLAAKLDFQNVATTASRLYTADYVGACLGALLVSTLLIPLLGVTIVCILTSALTIWSAGLLAVTSR